MLKRIGFCTLAWACSVALTTVLAVFFQTQNVIARLGGIGAEIGMADRLSMSAYDISHLGSLYGIFIGVAFIAAWFAAGGVFHFAKFGRPLIYAVAGAVAMIVMLFLMKRQFFDIHIIAGARNAVGLTLQMVAGAAGGLVFERLTRPKP